MAIGFEVVFLTAGEDVVKGLAILYNGIDGGREITVWGFGSQSTSHTISASHLSPEYEPLVSGPCDSEQVEDADAAFKKRLSEDSLFKELDIVIDRGWRVLGCDMGLPDGMVTKW